MKLSLVLLVPVLVRLLAVPTTVSAKLRIYGELPDKPLLLEALMTVDLNTRTPVAESNRQWINAVAKVVQHEQRASSRTGSVANWFFYSLLMMEVPSHAVTYHFSRGDARDILRPLLKRTHGIDLDDDTIEKLFYDGDMGVLSSIYSSDEDGDRVLSLLDSKRQLYEAAQRLQNMTRGGVLLSIGQTPAYLTHMMRALEASERSSTGTSIVELPISGRPDMVSEPLDKRHKAYIYDNIVTPDREAFYRQLSTDQGFYPKRFGPDDKIYMLDVSKGPSVAQFLLFVTRWFRDEGVALPDLFLVHMRKHTDIIRPANLTCGYDCLINHPLPELLDLKIHDKLRFDIDTKFLNMDDDLVETFDTVEGDLRVLAPFNAINWVDRYRTALTSYPTPKARKLLDEYYDYAIGQVMTSCEEEKGADETGAVNIAPDVANEL